ITLSYAGYLSGLSANVLLASTDANVTAVTADVLSTLEITKDLTISMASNYYFMCVSAFVLALIGTFVTLKFVEPALNNEPNVDLKANFDENVFFL
ncbi:MAG: AbgT family transporter, partial [Clostridia bacterium]|nr:AbgT family transporter [Clostridia bacterium]